MFVRLDWKSLPMTNTLASYENLQFTDKKVLKHWALYCKTLRFRNLREMDRFRSKLVSSGLDKHASLSKQAH